MPVPSAWTPTEKSPECRVLMIWDLPCATDGEKSSTCTILHPGAGPIIVPPINHQLESDKSPSSTNKYHCIILSHLQIIEFSWVLKRSQVATTSAAPSKPCWSSLDILLAALHLREPPPAPGTAESQNHCSNHLSCQRKNVSSSFIRNWPINLQMYPCCLQDLNLKWHQFKGIWNHQSSKTIPWLLPMFLSSTNLHICPQKKICHPPGSWGLVSSTTRQCAKPRRSNGFFRPFNDL